MKEFRSRSDTFVLGVCNGCQLLARLGWVSTTTELTQNVSKRFESRFVSVMLESDTFWTKDCNGLTLGKTQNFRFVFKPNRRLGKLNFALSSGVIFD